MAYLAGVCDSGIQGFLFTLLVMCWLKHRSYETVIPRYLMVLTVPARVLSLLYVIVVMCDVQQLALPWMERHLLWNSPSLCRSPWSVLPSVVDLMVRYMTVLANNLTLEVI